MTDLNWNNEVLKIRFDLFNRLIKRGFRIYINLHYQVDSGMYHIDPVTNLPYPDQEKNAFGDVALVTYETKVYLPKQKTADKRFSKSFNSIYEAYIFLAEALNQFDNKQQKGQILND